jgi:hypothetical protein
MQIRFKIGKTIWWSNIRSNTDSRWRHDTLFGITRAYSRTYKYYLYRITIGRFTIGFGK